MSLVGDIIQLVRGQAPDPAQVLPAPSFSGSNLSGATGGSLSGTLYFQLTATNQWGETLPSAEVSLVLGGNTAVQVSNVTLPPGATGANLYMGTVTGQENQMFPLTIVNGIGSLTILGNASIGKAPPLNASAQVPDSDGGFISAFSMYRLLNLSLLEMGRLVGGIKDLNGLQSQVGVAAYRSPTAWFSLANIWYDGWACKIANPNEIFLFNAVTGVTALVSAESEGQNPLIQLWPQPYRSGGVTHLASAMGVSDIVANTTGITVVNSNTVITSASNGFLQLGLMNIDQESMLYASVSGNQFTGIARGVGGTSPAAHASGATVTELNIRLSGYRMPAMQQVGNAANVLDVPPAWEVPLIQRMLSEIREQEQLYAQAASLRESFMAEVVELARNSRRSTHARQLRAYGQSGYRSFYWTVGGGILVS